MLVRNEQQKTVADPGAEGAMAMPPLPPAL